VKSVTHPRTNRARRRLTSFTRRRRRTPLTTTPRHACLQCCCHRVLVLSCSGLGYIAVSSSRGLCNLHLFSSLFICTPVTLRTCDVVLNKKVTRPVIYVVVTKMFGNILFYSNCFIFGLMLYLFLNLTDPLYLALFQQAPIQYASYLLSVSAEIQVL